MPRTRSSGCTAGMGNPKGRNALWRPKSLMRPQAPERPACSVAQAPAGAEKARLTGGIGESHPRFHAHRPALPFAPSPSVSRPFTGSLRFSLVGCSRLRLGAHGAHALFRNRSDGGPRPHCGQQCGSVNDSPRGTAFQIRKPARAGPARTPAPDGSRGVPAAPAAPRSPRLPRWFLCRSSWTCR